ncbi:MAG: LD-carboxypeptidase [Bdellovibrionales bacterium]
MSVFQLKPDMTVGVFAPSSYIEKDDILRASSILEKRGVNVSIHPQTYERQNQSAGTHAQKLDALHSLYEDQDIDAIWAAGGGNRALHLLADIGFEVIKDNPKPLIGFSDVTALLNSISVRADISNIHAPVFKHLHQHDRELDHLMNLKTDFQWDHNDVLKQGSAEGCLFGGNLSVFQYLPTFLGLDFLEGCILFLEDCNEELSRVDRMLCYLKHAGVFERISGLVLGDFSNLLDSSRPFGFSYKEIVLEHLNGCDIPVIMNVPFGHTQVNMPLHLGHRYRLTNRILEIF